MLYNNFRYTDSIVNVMYDLVPHFCGKAYRYYELLFNTSGVNKCFIKCLQKRPPRRLRYAHNQCTVVCDKVSCGGKTCEVGGKTQAK